MSSDLSIVVEPKVINGKEIPAVTSLQVAEVFGKEHKNVMRDIRETVVKCSESFNALNFELVEYTDAKGERRPMYLISKDGLMMVTMGYTTLSAMKIKEAYIAKFNEMEEVIRNGGYHLPRVPQSFSDALRMIADIEEAKEKAIAERDHAIRTKAEIGCRREATAMNTASQLSKENDKLRTEIGDSRHYKQVKAVSWLQDVFAPCQAMYSSVGKQLSKISREEGYEIREIADSTYGMVNAYHVDAVSILHGRLLKDSNMMWKYRKA